jgi:hypothetical protein
MDELNLPGRLYKFVDSQVICRQLQAWLILFSKIIHQIDPSAMRRNLSLRLKTGIPLPVPPVIARFAHAQGLPDILWCLILRS